MTFWNVPLDGSDPYRTTLAAERAARRYGTSQPRLTVEASDAKGALSAARRYAYLAAHVDGQHANLRGGVPVIS